VGLVTALINKGVFTAEALRATIEKREARGTAMEGSMVVVRAWTDPAFAKRLEEDANAAVDELTKIKMTCKLIAVFDTETLKNVIVCTLCSCYPTNLLGRPPPWLELTTFTTRTVSYQIGSCRTSQHHSSP